MSVPSPDPVAENAATGVISSPQPAPGEPAASPPAGRALLPSMLVTALTLFATYGGLIAILLPTQVALIDEQNKVANLAIAIIITSFGGYASLFVFAMVFVVLAAVAIAPIKGVR